MTKSYLCMFMLLLGKYSCSELSDGRDYSNLYLLQQSFNENSAESTPATELYHTNDLFPDFKDTKNLELLKTVQGQLPDKREADKVKPDDPIEETKSHYEAHPYKSYQKRKKCRFPFFYRKKSTEHPQVEKRVQRAKFCFGNCKNKAESEHEKTNKNKEKAVDLNVSKHNENDLIKQINEITEKKKTVMDTDEIEKMYNAREQAYNRKYQQPQSKTKPLTIPAKNPRYNSNDLLPDTSDYLYKSDGKFADFPSKSLLREEKSIYRRRVDDSVDQNDEDQGREYLNSNDPRGEQRIKELEEVQRKIALIQVKTPKKPVHRRHTDVPNLFYPHSFY